MSIIITTLNNKRSNINKVDKETGWTALLGASQNGSIYTIRILIDRGADIQFTDFKKGRNALHIAAKYGQPEAIEMLCSRGAIVNAADANGLTALMHAAKNGHSKCIQALLNRGANVILLDNNGYSPLHHAGKQGHKHALNACIEAGVPLDLKCYEEGKTALMLAAQYGRKESVFTLMDKGADINTKSSKEGLTALMLAGKEGHKGTVLTLLAGGAHSNLCDIYGWTALHFAGSWGRKETAGFLLVYGRAKIDYIGQTKNGAKPGLTPLMVAAKAGQVEIINLLVDFGATLDIKAELDGRSALAACAAIGVVKSIETLVACGADIEIRDNEQRTPLMIAAIEGQFATIICLLNNFADINCFDAKQNTAYDLATEAGHKQLFLSAILSLSAEGKANIIPWLELHLQDFARGSQCGSPSVFLNSFLYGKDGLFAGLLRRPEDCDVYLVYCLVMLASSIKKAIHKHPLEADDLTDKLDTIDRMLMNCMHAKLLCIDESFGDTLLLGKLSLRPGEFKPELLGSAFISGPLALCIDNELTDMLNVARVEKQIHLLFTTCQRSSYPSSGYSVTWMLRLRYIPAVRFVLEGMSKLVLLILVAIVSTKENDDDSSSLYETIPTMYLTYIEYALILFIATCVVYECGQIEEKMWAISPSMTFDFHYLVRTRNLAVNNHFFSDIWKVFDLLTIVAISIWIIFKYILLKYLPDAGLYVYTGKIALAMSAIPMALGLLRYPSAFSKNFGITILSAFLHTENLLAILCIFIATGVGFGVAFYGIFHGLFGRYDSGFESPKDAFFVLFNAIFKSYDLAIFDSSRQPELGRSLFVVFIVWVAAVLFNMIIAQIVVSHHDIRLKASDSWVLYKSRLVQQYILVLESSPLCMLPPPFNLLTSCLYIPHSIYTWRSRLYKNKVYSLSLAGTIADLVIAFLMLLPASFYDYFSLHVFNDRKKFYAKFMAIVSCPIGIGYALGACFHNILSSSPTLLLVKSRISDGRLRISYDKWRDGTEIIGLRDGKQTHSGLPIDHINDESSSYQADSNKLRVQPYTKGGENTRTTTSLIFSLFKPKKIEKSNAISMKSIKSMSKKDKGIELSSSMSLSSKEKPTPMLSEDKDQQLVASNDDENENKEQELNTYTNERDDDNDDDDDGDDFDDAYDEGPDTMQKFNFDVNSDTGSVSSQNAIPTPGHRVPISIVPQSLDFPPNRFNKLFTAVEQKKIFQEVLPEYYSDTFTETVNEQNVKLDSLYTINDNLMLLKASQTKEIEKLMLALNNIKESMNTNY